MYECESESQNLLGTTMYYHATVHMQLRRQDMAAGSVVFDEVG